MWENKKSQQQQCEVVSQTKEYSLVPIKVGGKISLIPHITVLEVRS